MTLKKKKIAIKLSLHAFSLFRLPFCAALRCAALDAALHSHQYHLLSLPSLLPSFLYYFLPTQAFVYKIPPRTSAMGHKASDWTDQVAVVRVQVVTRGTDAAVRLFRTDSGKVFANSPVRTGGPPAVEQVTDSSRYFALRIEDGKGEYTTI